MHDNQKIFNHPLGFIRRARNTLDALCAVCKGDKTVIVLHTEDFHVLYETLEWESQSAAFDPDIRRAIAKGLKRMRELNVDKVFDLRRQAARLEKRLQKRGVQ